METKPMEMDLDEERNNVSNVRPSSAELGSMAWFTEHQYMTLTSHLGEEAQRALQQLSPEERLMPSRVVPIIQAMQGEDQALTSLRSVARDDIVDMLRPNAVASLQGAQAMSLPQQDKKRFPRDSLYRDLPYEIRHEFEQRLGVSMPDGNDWRAFGARHGLQAHTLALIGEESLKRGNHVITDWLQKRGKKATLRELHTILSELGMKQTLEFLESYMEQ